MTRQRRPLQRRVGTREERQRFLIYCEGELTETSYLKGVRRELRAGTVQIELGRVHGEPYRLVQSAIDHQRSAPTRQSDRYEAYDQVWCVFDVEQPPHPRLDQAVQLAARHDVFCAISNPCFELWLLLHFRDHTAYLTAVEAAQRLAECGCGYSRRTKDVDYESVRSGRLVAHRRAELLEQRHREQPAIRNRNPWTSVHILVARLFDRAGPASGAQAS